MQLLGGHIRGIARLVATPLNNPPLLLNISIVRVRLLNTEVGFP